MEDSALRPAIFCPSSTKKGKRCVILAIADRTGFVPGCTVVYQHESQADEERRLAYSKRQDLFCFLNGFIYFPATQLHSTTKAYRLFV